MSSTWLKRIEHIYIHYQTANCILLVCGCPVCISCVYSWPAFCQKQLIHTNAFGPQLFHPSKGPEKQDIICTL